MKIVTAIIILLTLCVNAKAQNTTGTSKYRCRIYLLNPSEKKIGELYKTEEDSVVIKLSKNISYNKYEIELMPIPVSRIAYFSLNKKGSGGRGILIGGGIGALICGLIGYSTGDDSPTPSYSNSNTLHFDLFQTAGQKAAVGGTIGFILGGLIGFAAGSSRTIISLEGNHEKYKSIRKTLDGYSIER
jgi:hypothetical protein